MCRPLLQHLLRTAQRAADPVEATVAAWPGDLAGPSSILALGKAAPTMLRAVATRAPSDWPAPEHVFIAGPELLLTSDMRSLAGHVFAVDHPLPTPRNVAAACACEAWLASRPPDHALLVLLSGGVSAQLCAPMAGISLEDVVQTTRLLQLAGTSIHELNAVRKHLDRLKGGRMARCCSAKAIRVLAISDVIGDDPATIASGPFSPDPTTYQQALGVLTSRGVRDRVPSVARMLADGVAGMHPETPKTAEALDASVDYRIIASNAMVVEAVVHAARDAGLDVFHPTHPVEGEAREVGREMAMRVWREALARAANPSPTSFCWVLGGEWTVDVGEASGVGGPSQELAIAAAASWRAAQTSASSKGSVAILAYSTDGVDGPTDAAGAMLDGASLNALSNTELLAALAAHDVHTMLNASGTLIRTGPTGTNVNHIAVMVWSI